MVWFKIDINQGDDSIVVESCSSWMKKSLIHGNFEWFFELSSDSKNVTVSAIWAHHHPTTLNHICEETEPFEWHQMQRVIRYDDSLYQVEAICKLGKNLKNWKILQNLLLCFYLQWSQPQVYKSPFYSASFSRCQILPSIKQNDQIKSIYWFHQGYPVQFNQTWSNRSNLIKLDQIWSYKCWPF